MFPHDVLALFNLGRLYADKKKYMEAKDYYERLVEITPDDPIAWYNLAGVYIELDNPQVSDYNTIDMGIQCYMRTLELDPKHLESSFKLMEIALEAGPNRLSFDELDPSDGLTKYELHVRAQDAAWRREVERSATLIRARLESLLGPGIVRGLDAPEIVVSAEVDEHSLTVTLEDTAVPYDPLDRDTVGGQERQLEGPARIGDVEQQAGAGGRHRRRSWRPRDRPAGSRHAAPWRRLPHPKLRTKVGPLASHSGTVPNRHEGQELDYASELSRSAKATPTAMVWAMPATPARTWPTPLRLRCTTPPRGQGPTTRACSRSRRTSARSPSCTWNGWPPTTSSGNRRRTAGPSGEAPTAPPPPRGLVVLVGLEVLGQVVDAFREDRNLDLRGSGVAALGGVFLNQRLLAFRSDRHRVS